ncbi:hypothetical protein C9374_001393 [Naegleria lovaniensis]|uniref:NAD-dependent epimerase/dehydratase domain-containing protein n=1 Tax=Naegleria lovaniensis TaxID=51637 RepID=A0AA88GY44_NAELO|nr:uncharacterized protein C9374_001393 [Naegleria lovaniensis]KAG2387799.1 hypothetical protein C9374_001393 [Naegleria lovaniensis]
MKICVTGASGYVAGHIIQQLLQRDHSVLGLVRDLSNKAKYDYLFQHVKEGGATLEFAEAKSEQDYDQVFQGANIDVVIHTATPYFYTAHDPQKEIVKPAIALVKGVIESAIKHKVKRVVFTSSCGTILNFPIPANSVVTCQDWNTTSTLTNNPYFYSKVLAEKTAWNLFKEHQDMFELVVVNPSYVLGPLPSSFLNTSMTNFKRYLLGENEQIQTLTLGVVDVRDVAWGHVIAAESEHAVGKRLICNGTVTSFAELVHLIQKKFPQYGVSKYKVDELQAHSNKFRIDTQPLAELGLKQYRSLEQTIEEGVQSLFDFGLVEKL